MLDVNMRHAMIRPWQAGQGGGGFGGAHQREEALPAAMAAKPRFRFLKVGLSSVPWSAASCIHIIHMQISIQSLVGKTDFASKSSFSFCEPAPSHLVHLSNE